MSVKTKSKFTYRGIVYHCDTKHSIYALVNRNLTDEIIHAEFEDIRQNLYCNSVRILGDDPQILLKATKIAIEQHLTPWVSSRFLDIEYHRSLEMLQQVGEGLNRLNEIYQRKNFLIVANELSWELPGFVEGKSSIDRVGGLIEALNKGEAPNIEEKLTELVHKAKEVYKGKIVYAAGLWEKANWENTGIDILGINHYLTEENSGQHYIDIIKAYEEAGLPLVITEFGTATFTGARKYGGDAWRQAIIKRAEGESLTYDEDEQDKGIKEQLNAFNQTDISGYFLNAYVEGKWGQEIRIGQEKYILDQAGSYGILNCHGEGSNTIMKKAYRTFAQFNLNMQNRK